MSMFDGSGATVGTPAKRGKSQGPKPGKGTTPGTAAEVTIFRMLASELEAIGLGELFKIRGDGSPGGWLWDQIKQGFDTSEELMLALQQTDVFKERFSVIEAQKERAARGEPVYVMSPAEVIEYENRARQLMQAAGMPEWFFDNPRDFNDLILNDISPAELERRITQTFEYVDNAPPEVRRAFEEFYGVERGDKALAAYVLDPDRTAAQLERATRTAYAGGMGRRYDIQLSKAQAARIAALPTTEAGIVEGFEQIAAQEGLFEEGLFERGNLTAEGAGVRATFYGDAAARRALERRATTRSAVDRSSTGGAVLTNQGLTGAGSD